jgi:hypothetical protein
MASIISAGTTSGTALNMAGDTSGVLQLATNGSTTALTISTAQNVGIGTASPADSLGYGRALDIQSTAGAALYLRDSDDTSEYTWVSYEGGATKSTTIGNTAAGPMILSTNGTERMRIASAGNVLINTTTATEGGRLVVGYNGAAAPGVVVVDSSATATVNMMFFYKNGAVRGSIQSTATATAYNTSSDYRLKENIAPMTGALDKVTQLKPVTFTWKETGEDSQGFIAHELQAIVPDCVYGEKDAVDEEGKPIHQGVDTSFLVATLTAAIQEQQTIINDLKARITALEGAA